MKVACGRLKMKDLYENTRFTSDTAYSRTPIYSITFLEEYT